MPKPCSNITIGSAVVPSYDVGTMTSNGRPTSGSTAETAASVEEAMFGVVGVGSVPGVGREVDGALLARPDTSVVDVHALTTPAQISSATAARFMVYGFECANRKSMMSVPNVDDTAGMCEASGIVHNSTSPLTGQPS